MNYKKDYEEWLDDQLKGKSSADAKDFIDKELNTRACTAARENRITHDAEGMMIGSALCSIPFLAIDDMHPKYGYIRYDDGSVETLEYNGPSLIYRTAKAVSLGTIATVFVAGAVTFVVSKINAHKECIKLQKLVDKDIAIKEKENH